MYTRSEAQDAISALQAVMSDELDREIDNANNGNSDAARNVLQVLRPSLDWLDSNVNLLEAAPQLLEALYALLHDVLRHYQSINHPLPEESDEAARVKHMIATVEKLLG